MAEHENSVRTMTARERPSLYRDEPDTDAWPHGEMIDMSESPEEIREKAELMPPGAASKVPKYPFGLCISLHDDELEKLGLDGNLPDVGDLFEFFATAKVTSASSREKVDPATGEVDKCCCVELQIVGMLPHEFEPEYADRLEEEEARSNGRRRRFYGGDGERLPSYDVDYD